ncbi:MAG: VOC family protein [Myxococcales bacterium]|nr:VOC family protein [Myxococcales bacterium]
MTVEYVAYIALRVSDLERARRFYCDLLGFRVFSEFAHDGPSPSAQLLGLDSVPVRALFVERDGTRIELQHLDLPADRALPRARPQLGLCHFGLRVSDLDGLVAALEDAGATLLEASRFEHAELGSRVAVVEDPDGTRIELIDMPGDPRAPLGRPVSP